MGDENRTVHEMGGPLQPGQSRVGEMSPQEVIVTAAAASTLIKNGVEIVGGVRARSKAKQQEKPTIILPRTTKRDEK